MEGLDALLPFDGISRGRVLGPVFARPFRLLIFRIPAEIEDVPLRDTHVLEQHPRRVWQTLRNFAAILCREVFYHLIECGMSMTAIEEFQQMFTERLIDIHM